MIESARTWWAERSARERTMLGVMIAFLALFLIWFAIISPLMSALSASKARHVRGVTDLAAVQTKSVALRKLKANPPPPLGAPVTTFVALSAGEAGFTLSRNDALGTDRASISIASAKPPALFNWLMTIDERGVFVDQITIRPNSDATISVDATLKARGQ